MAKITREKFKTYGNVFDNFVERVLIKLMGQGHFEGIIGPLSIGKESNVFTAKHESGLRIVKIYRLETCDFNQMYSYIRTDPRYGHLSGQRRKVIFSWTQREYRNLMKCRLAGVRVPMPLSFEKNVLVEEFIGTGNEASPKLKDLPPKNPQTFYSETIRQMELMAKEGLVHGDLSVFNILNHEELPVIIDMSQSTTYDNPMFEELLQRDCRNITNSFRKFGANVETDDNLFKRLYKLAESGKDLKKNQESSNEDNE